MPPMNGMPADVNEQYPQEHCDECEVETPHEVTMRITETHTERPREENQKYARSPCRVTVCCNCGIKSQTLYS